MNVRFIFISNMNIKLFILDDEDASVGDTVREIPALIRFGGDESNNIDSLMHSGVALFKFNI